jgi:Na+/proline symporter
LGTVERMGIGAGIFLIVLGAILTFAVDWKVAGLDMHAVGWILMAAGAGGLILFFVFWNRRRTPTAVGTEPQGPDQPIS